MQRISSPENPKLRYLRRLQESRTFREAEGRAVLEGLRLVEAALEAGARPRLALVSEDLAPSSRATALLASLEAAGNPLLLTSPALFRQAADTQHPQGLLVAFERPVETAPSEVRLALVLDAWRDPGNLGTALRSAAAAGADLAVLTAGTVDPWHPRALRAGMGAQFLLPLVQSPPGGLAAALAGLDLYLADASGELDHRHLDWDRPTALLVGGEAEGPSAEALALPHRRVRIAMAGRIESLNAATAAAILLFAAGGRETTGRGS